MKYATKLGYTHGAVCVYSEKTHRYRARTDRPANYNDVFGGHTFLLNDSRGERPKYIFFGNIKNQWRDFSTITALEYSNKEDFTESRL